MPPTEAKLRGFGRAYDRKINFGLRDDVDEVRKDVLSYHGNDLHDLRVGESGSPDRLQIGVDDLATRLDDLRRKGHGSIRLGIGGSARGLGRSRRRRSWRGLDPNSCGPKDNSHNR
jgi:hypothetical protein